MELPHTDTPLLRNMHMCAPVVTAIATSLNTYTCIVLYSACIIPDFELLIALRLVKHFKTNEMRRGSVRKEHGRNQAKYVEIIMETYFVPFC